MQRVTLSLAVLAMGTALRPTPARANDLGCQVLLCLSNPSGATQYAQCVAPMTKLWQRLATGGSFPPVAAAVLLVPRSTIAIPQRGAGLS